MLSILATQFGPNLFQYDLEREIKFSFNHPTQVIQTDSEFWIAELHGGVVMTDSSLAISQRLVTPALKSPHFLAVDADFVYVSDGRGKSIFRYSREQKGLAEKLPMPLELNRPHGLCVMDKRWLYIADSVNSRLLRYDITTQGVTVFADHEKRVAYGRQLLCREDGLWLANSYESAFKLNPGRGGNVLHIADFDSGRSKVVAAFPNNNVTGLAILDDRYILVGRWSGTRDIVELDLQNTSHTRTVFKSDIDLDAPYGIHHDAAEKKLYIAFLGIHPKRSKDAQGAIQVWSYSK
jgi:hypothetical protein